MKFLFVVSLRNLFRQKRRNILLGSAIAFGVMILIIANSFSHGISDTLFNRIVVYVAGHVNISVNEGRGRDLPIFRDKDRLIKIVTEQAGDKLIEYSEGIAIFLRAVGNGKVQNMVLVGMETIKKEDSNQKRKESDDSFQMISGEFNDLSDSSIENPVVLSKEKVDALSVKLNDIIRIKYRNVYGQTQSARLTVVGVMSNDNIFMQGVMLVELSNLKQMMGYRPYECGAIKLTLKNPKEDSVMLADKIQSSLKPNPAFIFATVKKLDTIRNLDSETVSNIKSTATLLPFMGNSESLKNLMISSFKPTSYRPEDVFSKDGLMISNYLAQKLKLNTGDKIEFSFKPKFESKEAVFSAVVKGIFISDENSGKETIYMHEALFYPKFYENLPDLTLNLNQAFIPKDGAKI